MHFGTLERFKYSAVLNGLSHVLLYIVTSFGLTYFTSIFGNNGILVVSLLATSLFIYGTYEFIKLEKANGDYNRDFNHFSIHGKNLKY